MTTSTTPKPAARRTLNQRLNLAFDVLLLALLLLGVSYRFYRIDWNQGASLHPDEYGLTNTLTQLHLPLNPADYFNTRISPMSPYQRYDAAGKATGDGPDNAMRWGQWPMILIRAAAETTGATGYDELRLMGRGLSALVDCLSLGLIYLIGRRLYSRRVGLLAATLSSLAVMQIQQSHFMTVDNFSVFFTCLTLLGAVWVSQTPPVLRLNARQAIYRLNPKAWGGYVLFGAGFGMVMASKINLLPLAGLLLVAAFISVADLKLKAVSDLWRITGITFVLLASAGLLAFFTFRLTQPMSFRATQGDTFAWTLSINPDWWRNMQQASTESNGVGGGPPGEQWTQRAPILFPLMNMVVWGLGLPLGLMSWSAFLAALYQVLRWGKAWRAHLIPLVWVGGYFLFMGTRWVKSIRYFLPIYPFLCLLAAWGLVALWRWALARSARHIARTGRKNPLWLAGASLLAVLVVGGSVIWANAFVQAVYRQDHTRIRASRWILENIPAAFHLTLTDAGGESHGMPVPAPDVVRVEATRPTVVQFVARQTGKLQNLTLAHITTTGLLPKAGITVQLARDPAGQQVLDETSLQIESPSANPRGESKSAAWVRGATLEKDVTYFLVLNTLNERQVVISRPVVANESWDEGIPVRIDGYDPFGELYHGVQMEVRWGDDENKKKMFLENLAGVDYIFLPSQRAIWSSCRLPLNYPMTLEYYRALFDGRLGFDLAARFDAPWQIGPLWISDVGGTLAWGQKPALPLFNHNPFAVEEAFSVYDHPPVWVFRKRADFNLENAAAILNSIDLSKVVVQSPRDVTVPVCR